MVKRPFAIFYVESNKAYFYGSTATSVLQIEIPADTLSYMDVINRDKFNQIIQTFVTTNKIEPASLLVLFSTYATYDKEVTGKLPDEINNDIQQFLDSVPFERVLSRIYKLQDKIRVVAVNKDLYEAIKHAFEKMHFPTVAVASLPLLQKMLPEIGQTLNMELLATRFEAIKPFSLITLEEINNPGRSKQQQQGSSNSEKPNPLRLYGLVGVFVVLIGILVYMVMTTMQPAPVVVKPIRHVVVPTPTAIPTEAVSSESGKLLISPTPEVTGKPVTQ